jgi:hypothetical protein
MAKGLKTGGRQKGSRNKRTEAQVAAIENSGLTPLDYMLTVLRDPEAKCDLRMEAARSAAPYVHPKLSNVELTGKDGGPLSVNILRFDGQSSSTGVSPRTTMTNGKSKTPSSAMEQKEHCSAP